MSTGVMIRFEDRSYVWDGHLWYGADDYTVPPQVVIHKLDHLLRLKASEVRPAAAVKKRPQPRTKKQGRGALTAGK